MGDWVKKDVLGKAKIITTSTNAVFKLSNYTKGVAWGNHIIKANMVNMEQGFDTFGVETEIIKTGQDIYHTKLFRQGVKVNQTANYYSIPYTGFGPAHTIVSETNLGGISIAIQVYDCIPPVSIYVVLNGAYYMINQSYNYSSFSTTAVLKVPAVDNVTGTLQVQLIPAGGQVYTVTRADITYFKFYKVREEISGTTNVIAYEVE